MKFDISVVFGTKNSRKLQFRYSMTSIIGYCMKTCIFVIILIICDNISCNSCHNKNVSHKICEEHQNTHFMFRGTLLVAQWLRHYATNRNDAGSIPDGVIGIFH
jgi:hypothetical protein